MKPTLPFLLAVALIIAGCGGSLGRTTSIVCQVSCDEILTSLGRVSRSLDEALAASRTADKLDDAGRYFKQTDDQMDELSKLLKNNVTAAEHNPVQLTDEIMRTSSQSSDDLIRLENWAETKEGIEFYGTMVCAYRDAYEFSWKYFNRDPYIEEIGAYVIKGFSGAPTNGAEFNKNWNELVSGLKQNQINVWDSSITLYCLISDLPEFAP